MAGLLCDATTSTPGLHYDAVAGLLCDAAAGLLCTGLLADAEGLLADVVAGLLCTGARVGQFVALVRSGRSGG
jgi:hypothetical protein